MKAGARLGRLERIVDRSAVAERIEALLPIGVRPRQLRARTLLVGMALVACDARPAHLSRVHGALTSLPEAEQRRLGVIAEWRDGPHRLTYRQVERTFSLIAGALAKEGPDGRPSELLQEALDALLEASVEVCGDPRTSSYAGFKVEVEVDGRKRARSTVSFHTFRHTCASLLFQAGRNVKQVQAWLGHADPGFTLRTYIHLIDEGVGGAEFLDEEITIAGEVEPEEVGQAVSSLQTSAASGQ